MSEEVKCDNKAIMDIISETLETVIIFNLQDSYLDLVRIKSFLLMCIYRNRYLKILKERSELNIVE